MARSALRVLSLVEKGWSAARQATIPMTQRGARVTHLVRGRLPRALLRVITPYDGMTIRGIDRRWYRVIVWILLAFHQWVQPGSLVLVDNQPAVEWVRRSFPRLAHGVVLVQETAGGTPVLLRQGAAVTPESLIAEDAT